MFPCQKRIIEVNTNVIKIICLTIKMNNITTVLLLTILCCTLMPFPLLAMSYDYIYDNDFEYYKTNENKGYVRYKRSNTYCNSD